MEFPIPNKTREINRPQFIQQVLEIVPLKIAPRVIPKIRKEELELEPGIYTDASYKKGHCQIAIVRYYSKEMYDISVRRLNKKDFIGSIAVEEYAIIQARLLFPGVEPIFTDCEGLAKKMNVRYISRSKNRLADLLAGYRIY